MLTTVSSGRVNSRSRMAAMIWLKSEYSQRVAPGPPSNRVSPVKTTPSVTKHVAPGVCPGVVTARSVALAMVNSSPSLSGWNEGRGRRHVVPVAVRQQQRLHLPVADCERQAVGLVSRVDDDHLPAVADDPGVVLEVRLSGGLGDQLLDVHVPSLPRS